MFQPNLIKPPKILDEIISQDSENYTNNSRQKPTRPKHSSKENTIRLVPNAPPQMPLPRQHDNQSVHSNASGRSKGKKTKESTLARPKIMSNFNENKDDDNHSVHSNASKNSHKSGKKQNTIMAKPKIEGAVKQKQNQHLSDEGEEKFTSFKSAWKEEDESVINPYFVQKKALRNINDLNVFKEAQKRTSKGKFAPFAQIQQQHFVDEQPVIQLLQPAEYNNKQLVVGAKKNQEASKAYTQSRMIFDESNVIIGQSKMRQTKSRRRNIFQKSALDNTSKVSQSIAQSSVLGQSNRSKSKRREIFNNSREKQRKAHQESRGTLENQSNMISIGPSPIQSKEMSSYRKPSPQKVNAFVQLEKKVLNNDNDQFGLDQSKSDLNLSASNHLGRDTNDRDSLILHLEPEKKKGVSIVGAKNYREAKQSAQNMIQIQNKNLASIGINQSNANSKDMVKVNNTLISKELQDVKKLLSANQQYLNNLQNVALADSYQSNNKISNNTLNVNKDLQQNQKPWHQIVNDFQQIQPLNIKKVQRNEKLVNKTEEKNKVAIEKETLAEQQRKRAKQKQDQELRKAQQLRQQEEKKRRDAQRRIQQQRKREKQERQREIERERQQKERQQQRIKKQNELNRKRQLQQEERARQERQRIREQEMRIQKLRQQKIRQQRIRKQKQIQKQKQNEAQEREKELRMKKLASLPSQISRQEFSQNSQQSNKSSKKRKQKKESSLTRDKNHKVYVRAQSPRGEESFYQSQNQPSEQLQDKQQQLKEKKPKLLSFEQQDFQTKPKARTDINFYDNAPSQKSLKPPSSKPPLSKRTNGSGGSLSKQKKPKQKTIAITIKEQSIKQNKSNLKQKEPKKMSLMERALMKHNQQSSNGSYSQDSYRNRDQMDSQQSRGSNSSKKSKGSLKKQSTLKISKDNMIHSKYANLPPRRQSSNSSSHQEQMQRIERQRISQIGGRASRQKQQQKLSEVNRMKEQILNDRVIVSKNCTYIDERGRLVTQDLVIKGKQVYGIPSSNKNIDQTVIQRMKRSRQDRRSRSKSRQRNKLNRKNSRDGSENESNQNSSYGSSSFYGNSSRATLQRNQSGSVYSNFGNYQETNTLKQFIKPVQHVPNMYDHKNRKAPIKEEANEQPRTLNDMFTRKTGKTTTNNFNNESSTMQNSRSRKSLGRTEKTFYKK